MFRFLHPEYFYLLIAVPVLLALYILYIYIRQRRLAAFGNMAIIRQLMPEVSYTRGWVKLVFVLMAITLLVAGLAGPQFGSKLTEANRRGIELIIALDVSNSMLAQDIQPSRMERAKQAISRLTDQLTTDRIGLIVFAAEAYVQLPVTNDYVSAKMFLNSIGPGMVSEQGTAVGRAINLAVSSFSPQEDVKKAIVVISDGESHEDDPVEAARMAAERGITVYGIGIGSTQGAPIPMATGNGGVDFLKDREGNVVVTRLDEETLTEMAIAGGGKYVRATNMQIGLQPLFEEINRLERVEFKEKIYSEYQDQFQYLLALAIIFILLDFLLLERKNRFIAKLNLFGSKNK